jgi:type IV secretion system protein TrbJ
MKLTMTKHKKYLIFGSLVLATATPSFAIFGVGDIVFDPTSYASLVSQATTALNQLKTIQSNVEHFSIKQQWQTALTKLENVNVASMFGETAGINIALNANSPSASLTGWKTATVPMSSGTSVYLQAQNVNSAQRAQLAMIETSDAISPDCLTAVGAYRSGRSQNSIANSLLAQQQLDITSSTNSEVEQLNESSKGLPLLSTDASRHGPSGLKCSLTVKHRKPSFFDEGSARIIDVYDLTISFEESQAEPVLQLSYSFC